METKDMPTQYTSPLFLPNIRHTLGFFPRDMDDPQLLANVLSLKHGTEPPPVLAPKAAIALIKTRVWSRPGPSTVSAME